MCRFGPISRVCLLSLFWLGLCPAQAETIADVPDLLEYSEAEFVVPIGEDALVLMVVPDGSGPDFTSARRLSDGAVADGRIKLTLRDAMYDPVVNYPEEDLWLEADDDGVASCDVFIHADGPTDADGVTYWSLSPRAGGHSSAGVRIMINGDTLPLRLPLYFNSPDITGDLEVGLYDLSEFASDYFLHQQLRSDFNADGEVNVVDLSIFATAYAAECP